MGDNVINSSKSDKNNNHISIGREYFENTIYSTPDSPATKRYASSKLSLIGKHLEIDKSMSVLDVGCGNGVFSARLSELAGSVVGTDLSQNMLRINPLGAKVQCDAERLPFPDNSFDLVFEANLLHHVDSSEAVVKEMARVSRSRLVFIEPNIQNPLMLAFGLINPVERGSLVFTPGYMRGVLERCDVNVETVFATGMITQNKTPAFLIPLLGLFDFKFPFGEYIVAIGNIRHPVNAKSNNA